jgi:2-hydroxychromene-2-carboxylate isomerase
VTLSVDLFWSFRSPYSYLALPRACALVASHDVEIHARPVYPLAVRDPTFFKRTNPQFAKYVVLDSTRVAAHDGIPFRFPRPDPIVQDMRTLEVASEQPRIRRLMRLGAAAQLRGCGLSFIRHVSAMLWDGSVDQWDEGDHLARACERADLSLGELDAGIATDPDKHEAVIARNQADHANAGHWGVPTFVFEGEPFFGQDRFDFLVWRLRERGLRSRQMSPQT